MFDIRCLCMDDAAKLAGLRPAKPDPVCEDCGGTLYEYEEITRTHPWGSGYDVLECTVCGKEAGRRWVGH